MPEPRKHHYVPRSVLRNFSSPPELDQLFAFDKKTGRSFRISVDDAAAERDFNRVVLGDWEINYEFLFQDLDNRLATVVSSIVAAQSLEESGEQIPADLPILLACQLVRTKVIRTSTIDLTKQLSEWMASLGLGTTGVLEDADARRVALDQLFEMDKLADILRQKDFVLLVVDSGELWISDNPVVKYNTFAYGGMGLASPGIEIYYPMSPKVCIALYCPSVREMLVEAYDADHPRPAPADPLISNLHESLQTGVPLHVDDSYCKYLNELQTKQSSRFLYSSSEDFDLAETNIQKMPQSRDVTSLFEIDSSPVPPVPGFPEGDWLVLEKGHRHYCLSIALIITESVYIEFSTTDLVKLSVALKDQPFDSATVYRNGKGIRGMRDIVIAIVDGHDDRRLRLEHADPGLNNLLETIE